MGPPSYMPSVVDRNVVMRRIPVSNLIKIRTVGAWLFQAGRQTHMGKQTIAFRNFVSSPTNIPHELLWPCLIMTYGQQNAQYGVNKHDVTILHVLKKFKASRPSPYSRPTLTSRDSANIWHSDPLLHIISTDG